MFQALKRETVIKPSFQYEMWYVGLENKPEQVFG
jgi:hypothetical protein